MGEVFVTPIGGTVWATCTSRGARGAGGGRESWLSLSDSISMSPTSVMSSLAAGSEVAVH